MTTTLARDSDVLVKARSVEVMENDFLYDNRYRDN